MQFENVINSNWPSRRSDLFDLAFDDNAAFEFAAAPIFLPSASVSFHRPIGEPKPSV